MATDRSHAGLDVRPFVATRYGDPAQLPQLTSPAYDLIPPADRERLADADEHSIVHLTLPTFGADDAARRLALWRRDGTLVVDDRSALYVYDLAEAGMVSTRGWVAAVGLPATGIVSPHEATVAAAVADRLALREATRADLEPVVLTHDGEPGAADELAHRVVAQEPPLLDLTDDGGVRHRLWRVADPEDLATVRTDFACRRAVIADGHHRWAASITHQRVMSAAGPWDRGLALLVPTGPHGPRVESIHRVVPGLALDRAAAAASDAFRADPVDPPADPWTLLASARDTLVLLTDGVHWVRLTGPDRDLLLREAPPGWRDLDVALVDAGLAEARWHSADAVLLRHSVASAVATARETRGVAVLVRPTPAAVVLDLAARGVLMPRKSTLFVPKPRTGLVLRRFADEPAG
jgi:uncharacterized protein (DUF1015 family)